MVIGLKISYIKYAVSLFVVTFLGWIPTSAAISISIQQGLVDRYQGILTETGETAENFTQFEHKRVTKGVASLIVIKKALALGGLPSEFEFVISPNTLRGIALVKSGRAVMSQQTMFKDMFSDDLLMSTAVLEKEDFIKGIYGLASNESLMNVKTFDDLKALTAVTNTAWEYDIAALKQMELQKLHVSPNYDALFKLIQYRNVDFTLLEFSKRIEAPKIYEDIELMPVPNVAIQLNSDRHFMVSKRHPDGTKVLQALNKGLAILRSQGLLKEYYQRAKVIRADLAHWKVLNRSEN